MSVERNFEAVCYKYNAVGYCTAGNYSHNWITKLYDKSCIYFAILVKYLKERMRRNFFTNLLVSAYPLAHTEINRTAIFLICTHNLDCVQWGDNK